MADDCTNVLLSSTRMEALGMAAVMSFAREWGGRVECMLDNKGVVGSWKRLRRPAPSEWAKVADRDVHGYIALLRQELAGVWRVRHVKGHAERRKRRELWTLHEVGNDAVDKMAGRVSAAVVAEVRQWDRRGHWRAR